MGRVQLEVLFGRKGNSRREPIWFEVVGISSPYHALLGRPDLAKFMAVPHYVYLKMKLPGIVLKIRPVTEPVRPSVEVFTGWTVGSPVQCLVFYDMK
jgi:hypothetical protein